MCAESLKFFTPEKATKTLPLVKTIVSDILKKGQCLRSLVEKAEDPQVTTACTELQNQIEELMEELEKLGCFYKDWNFQIGLVDFPSIIDGEKVLLCWRSDEQKLLWYHSFAEGYAGRKLIPLDLLGTASPSPTHKESK